MRKLIIFVVCFLIGVNLSAFPLKKLKKGDKIDLLKLNAFNKNGKRFVDNGNRKIIFIWRYDKRLSKKTAKRFVRVCRDRKLNCISIETKNASFEIVEKIIGSNIPDNIFFAKNTSIVKTWGIFTLPVTVFLDKNDKIIHAIGYEGQYIVKVERFLDFLEGKISKEELEKLESSPVNRKVSVLPDLNYMLRLIKDNQKEDALKKLNEIQEKLDLKKLNEFEKTKYAYLLIKLEKYKMADKVLSNTNKNDIKSKFYHGLVLYKTGKLDKALKQFQAIEKIYPDKKAIYFYIAKIYKNKGDFRNAAEFFEKAFKFLDIDF